MYSRQASRLCACVAREQAKEQVLNRIHVSLLAIKSVISCIAIAIVPLFTRSTLRLIMKFSALLFLLPFSAVAGAGGK
jgi:hypothetical protein